ncbi:MAG TPA: Trp family transcriptional regulator [Candidatus Paceibacterota bacterium]
MSHVSKQKLKEKTIKEIDTLLVNLVADTSIRAHRMILREILTDTERLMIGKRLAMLKLIERDISTYHISRLLKVSPSTVARFETKVEKGGYRKTREWLRRQRNLPPAIKILLEFAAIPFEARRQNLTKLINEAF